ncbi:MAG: ATP-binding protein, partial [Candidatus Moraniibacteriota bacterium]
STKMEGNDYLSLIQEGESDYVEFKSSLRWDYHNGNVNKKLEYVITKTVAAFLNSSGGKLFIGVDDNGEILGLEKDYKTVKNNNKDGFLLQLDQIINNYLGKENHHYISSQIVKLKDKDVCVIEIINSGQPVYVKSKESGDQEFFVRAAASSQPMDMKEANEYIKHHWANN